MPDIAIQELVNAARAVSEFLTGKGFGVDNIVHPQHVVILIGEPSVDKPPDDTPRENIDATQPFSTISLLPSGKVLMGKSDHPHKRLISIYDPESFPAILDWIQNGID